MVCFTIKLADIPIRAEVHYASTASFCRDYLCEDTEEYRVAITQDDIDKERRRAEYEYAAAAAYFTDAYLETLALYRKITVLLLEKNVLLFHGAGISVKGSGVLFTAPSGTGKTTHIRLWQQLAAKKPTEVTVVNGDKPLVRIGPQEVKLYGTPWRGKEGLGTNTSAPLKAIVLLHRGERNAIERISPQQAICSLLQQSFCPDGVQNTVKYLGLLDRLAKEVEFFLLHCNMDVSAAEAAYQCIFEGDRPDRKMRGI